MHKNLKIVLFLLAIHVAGFGQECNFISGVMFNANGIHVVGESDAFWNSRNGTIWGTGGLSVACFVQYGLLHKIYSSMEVRYIRKGSIFEYTDASVAYALPKWSVLKLDYIGIPLLIGKQIKYNSKNKFSIETGFGIAKLFSKNIELDNLNPNLQRIDLKNFREIDFSWIGSVKKPIKSFKKNFISIGIRVERSLLSIHNNYKLYNFNYGLELVYHIN